jgi:hypothetical protein
VRFRLPKERTSNRPAWAGCWIKHVFPGEGVIGGYCFSSALSGISDALRGTARLMGFMVVVITHE